MYKIPNDVIIEHLTNDFEDNTPNIGGSFLVKKNYLNYVQEFINKNNDDEIVSLQVFRQPIGKALELGLRLLSLGKFRKEKYGYDSFFHLGLIATMSDNRMILIEKNATIDIKQISNKPQGQYMNIPMTTTIKLSDFLDNARKDMGDKYFTYNPFSNNCQNYAIGLLKSNHLLSSDLNTFIHQDISDYKNKIVNFIGDKVTNLAAIGHRIIKGGSFSSKYHRINV